MTFLQLQRGETTRSRALSQRTHAILAFVISALIVGFIGFGSIDGSIQADDAAQNMTYAYNLAKYNTFSFSRADDPELVTPDSRREPLYPFLIAAVLATFTDVNSYDLECFHYEEACASIRLSIKLINIPLAIALAWMMIFTVRLFFERWAVVYFTLALLFIPNYFLFHLSLTELPAALFLLMHCTFMYLAITSFQEDRRKHAYVYGTLSSSALGLLILTKSIFLYWLPLLAFGLVIYWLFRGGGQRPSLALITAALVIPGLLISGAWTARVYREAGVFQVTSGRDGSVLAVRAEFMEMTNREYLMSFVFFTSPMIRPLFLQFIDEANFQRLDRRNDDSFYRRARIEGGTVRAVAEEIADGEITEDDLRAAAMTLIRENPARHITLIPVFAYRGAFVTGRPHTLIYEPFNHAAFNILGWIATVVVLLPVQLAIPALFWMSFLALRRQQYVLLMFFLPALYSYGIHAAITHYISRYSIPLVPVFIIAMLLAGNEIITWWRARKKVAAPFDTEHNDTTATSPV